MIRFACRQCNEPLEVPPEMAGAEVQCPRCGILNDAPNFSDANRLNEDGTFRIDQVTIEQEPERLAELMHAYARKDTEGEELDHRGPVLEAEDGGYALADEARADLKPKYDPETGELIRPIEVREDPARQHVDPTSIPLAKPALVYASGTTARQPGLLHALLDLFQPLSLFVILIIFIAHLTIGILMWMIGFIGFPLAMPLLLFLLLALTCHWGNVVDEIGREQRNELPRPFRDLRWTEDVWEPLGALWLAMLICYGPARIAAAVLANRPQIVLSVTLPLELLATFFFPAVFLTAVSSGSIVNLHPMRVWRVIRACGTGYAIAVLAWSLAATPYFLSLAIIAIAWRADALKETLAPLMLSVKKANWVPLILIAALAVGVFLMHWFSWMLGLLYRAHHHEFPWAFQYHVRGRRDPLSPAPIPAPRAPRTPGRARMQGALRVQELDEDAAPAGNAMRLSIGPLGEMLAMSPSQRLLGRWALVDANGQSPAPGKATNGAMPDLVIRPEGILEYVADRANKSSTVRLGYSVVGDQIVTEHASSKKMRTRFWFDENDRLTLESNGQRSMFRRLGK